MFVVALVVFDSMDFAQFEDEVLLLAVVGVVVVDDDGDDIELVVAVAEAVVPWVSHLVQFGNRSLNEVEQVEHEVVALEAAEQ